MNSVFDARPIEILLVEDNPGDVRLTQEALSDAKVRNNLHIAGNGEEAMDFLRRKGKFEGVARPDLVLLDLNLPKKNGMEVLDEMKHDETLRTIPVVILTTSEAERDISKAYNSHANCYIAKPLDLDQFVKVIKTIEAFWFSIVKLPQGTKE
ncbi:TPA: response regulator [Candidatus Sumerlaeota bacterium]|nr:response regulator [Candidatus Sumerlaeota bacterium]